GRAEVLAETPDGNRTGAAVEPLPRKARQARDGFRDAGVRQLADILCGNRFNYGGGVSLGIDRIDEACAELSGDDDLFDLAFGVVLGECVAAGDSECK